MKKFLCLVSLLILQQQAAATCTPVSGPTGSASAFMWTMNIKNSSPHTLLMSGSCTNPNSIAKGATQKYTGMLCYLHSLSSTQCVATDQETGQSVTLTANYTSCVVIKPDAQANQQPSSLYPFYCDGSYTPGTTYQTTSCGTNLWTNTQTMFFDVYYFPNYTLTWNNLLTNLVKGQTMANRLATTLENAIDYHEATSAYSQKTQQLNITLEKGWAPDPYQDADAAACNAMQPAS